MSSLFSLLGVARDGMQAQSSGVSVTGQNIANVNTPGYVRKHVIQSPLVVGGQGMGVSIEGVERVTDQYLQLASLTASSDASRWKTSTLTAGYYSPSR